MTQAADSVCVQVKIEIDQELTLERQGFEARLNLINAGAVDLTNLNVTLNFADQNKVPVVATSNPNNTTAKFFIRLTSSETLPAGVTAGNTQKIRWLIIPAPAAAGSDPTGLLYFVGAKLSYSSGGVNSSIDVSPDSIRVLPVPSLTLDYFLPYDVDADDPLTPQIEPAFPFSLGVRVKNSGYGTAHALKIESGQPKIVENIQGLLISFHIDGSEVNGQPATPSLLADFGDIASNRSGVGRWLMTTSLSGRFVDFTATFTHADELGGKLTSLISDLRTHRLVHDVLVDLPGRDGVRDFLASDDGALKVYESENNDASVLDVSAQSTWSATAQGGRVSVPSSVGFSYVKLLDPFVGAKAITSVIRSDGRPINANNAWLSSTYITAQQRREYSLNIFDINNASGASYDLTFGARAGGNRAPVLRQPGDRVVHTGAQVGFLVQATDADGDFIALTYGSLPVGATFVDGGQGTGTFLWTPTAQQTGNFPLQFTASDGSLSDRKTAVITVTSGSLLKEWRNRYWPGVTDPVIIGNIADFDGDELTNLVEYALGLDPTVPSLDGAPEIGTVEIAGKSYLSLTYVVRTDDSNLHFAVVAADSIKTPDATWTVVAAAVAAAQTDVPPGFQRFTVRDDAPIDGTRQKRFLRLRVSTTEAD